MATSTNHNPNPSNTIRLVCVSDTHNHAPGEGYKLPAGDILIHAGDLTNQGSLKEIAKAMKWIQEADFAVKIVVAGNHDLSLDEGYHLEYAAGWTVLPSDGEECRRIIRSTPGVTYLEHESVEVEVKGRLLRIFGSPWTIDRGDQNWAFQYEVSRGSDLWSAVPECTDILVTHGPAEGILDASRHWLHGGCPALRETVNRVQPLLHVCGHHHEGRGGLYVDRFGDALVTHQWIDPGEGNKKQSLLSLRLQAMYKSALVNASIMNSSWMGPGKKGFNKPIVVDISVGSICEAQQPIRT